MAVTCSEESLKSLHMVNDQTAPGLTPIHTIAARWPMMDCPIEVQLSRERALTLLEKHTLRAFRDIEDVSAADIADNLGLFEPMLIDEALSTLQNSGAIQPDIRTAEATSVEENLRDELRLLDAKLSTSSYFGQTSKELRKQKKIVMGRIRAMESNRGGMRARLSNAFERLRGFTATITKSGLTNLLKGRITEPQKKEVLTLIRSSPDGKVMTSRGHGFAETDLRPTDNSRWSPVENNTDFNPITQGDVETALRESGQLQGGLVIQEIKPHNPSSRDLRIHLTLCVRHEDSTPEIVVHAERVGRTISRLTWAEGAINSNAATLEGVLSEFRKVLPKATGAEVNCEEALPLVLLPQYLNRQANSNSRSPIVARNREKLFEAKGSQAAFNPLLNSRTFIDLKNGKSGYSPIHLTKDDDLLQYEVMMQKPPLPASGSIAMMDGLLVRGKVIVKMPEGSNDYEYPVLIRDEEKGQSIVYEITERLRSGMDSENAYLYSRREDDLRAWVDEIVSEFEHDWDVFYGIIKLKQTTRGTGHNVYRMVTESLFSNKPEFVSEYGAMAIFEELARHDSIPTEVIWHYFEPRIQQTILQQSLGSSGLSNDFDDWIKHRSSEQLLPWEDAATLEAALFGHCYHTKGRLVLRFESIINGLTVDSKIYPENLASNIASLAQAGVIPEDLAKGCFELKDERNDRFHEEGHTSSLESTQSSIVLVRRLREQAGGHEMDPRFSEPNQSDHSVSMEPEEMVDYLEASSKTITSASRFGLSCQSEVWAKVLRDRLPPEFSEFPEALLSALHDAPELSGDFQFSSMSEEIVLRSSEAWVDSIPESSLLDLSQAAERNISLLTKLGMDKSAKSLGAKLAVKAPMPTEMAELLSEVKEHHKFERILLLPDLRARWKKAVTARGFSVTLKDLKKCTAKSMEPLGKVSEQLAKKAITTEIEGMDKGDAESVVELISNLEKLPKHWHERIESQDGYLSDRATQKIRKGGDLSAAAEFLTDNIPVNDKRFPKTNKGLRQIQSSRKKKGKS